MMTMRVQAVADDEMPCGHEWAVVETAKGDTLMLVRASLVNRSPESERLLNEALARAS